MPAYPDVKTPKALADEPADYRHAVEKIVVSHAINELHGARVFDEVAVAFAPTPYWKWLTCRVAMEEYGHHVRFFRLGREIGVPEDAMLPDTSRKRTLSIFDLDDFSEIGNELDHTELFPGLQREIED